jgi:hypothetical protein
MDYVSAIITALGGFAAAFWLWFGARVAWFLHEAVLTQRAADSPAPAAWPRMSVVALHIFQACRRSFEFNSILI